MVFKPFNERIQIAVISDASLASCHYLFQGICLRVPFLPIRDRITVRVSSIRYCLIFKVRSRCPSGSLFIISRKVLFVKYFFEIFLRPGGVLRHSRGARMYYTHLPPFCQRFFGKIFKFFCTANILCRKRVFRPDIEVFS